MLGAIARHAARQCLRGHRRALAAYVLVSAAPHLRGGVGNAARHPFKAPAGFVRRRTRGSALRRIMRVALRPLRCGDLRARIKAMPSLTAHPERAVATIVKRWRKGLIASRLVAAAPPASMLSSIAAPCALAPNSS